MESSQKKIVTLFYEEIWNRKNILLVSEVLDKELIFRSSIGEEKQGLEGFIEYHSLVVNSLKNYKCKILELIEEGNKISAKMEFTGKHVDSFLGYQPTNKKVSWFGIALFTFKKNKISSIWVLGDLKSLVSQLSGKEND